MQEHPLCRMCLSMGQTQPAQCVDHIQPHRGNKQLFWDESNWQPLCNSCHSAKTRREQLNGDV